MSGPKRAAIVVPCYNEAERLDIAAFEAFARDHPDLQFFMVDDGSTDHTQELLLALDKGDSGHFECVIHPENRGKAEAVRTGMQAAQRSGAPLGGYWDADLSTPLWEIPLFVDLIESRPALFAVFGARVQLLGRAVERQPVRRILGRLFATAVSGLLRLPIYDTQCGAKIFRLNEVTEKVFEQPFSVKWTFDVEILARLMTLYRGDDALPLSEVIYEYPLEQWRDVQGSKLRPSDFVRSFVEIAQIWRRYL